MTSVRPLPAWHEADRAGIFTMRERQQRLGGAAIGGADAGDNLDRHAGGAQIFRFLAAAPEDEWIAAFQPHDIMASLGLGHQQRVDVFLRQGVPGAFLRDRNQTRIGADHRHDFIGHEAVMHDQARPLDQPRGLERQEIRITGPSTDQIDGAELAFFGRGGFCHGPKDGLRRSFAQTRMDWTA